MYDWCLKKFMHVAQDMIKIYTKITHSIASTWTDVPTKFGHMTRCMRHVTFDLFTIPTFANTFFQ